MKKSSELSKAEMRHEAETKLGERKQKKATIPATGADPLRLLHELEVHQIELEMQSEELVQARAEAEEIYRQYTDLYDFAPVGYFTLAQDGTICKVNLAGANLLGVERAKLINRRLGLSVSAQSRPAFNIFFEKLLSGAGKETSDLAFEKNKGEIIWARFEATCFEGGQESRVVIIDITERKQAEEKLRESEQTLRSLIANYPDTMYILDLENHIARYLNREEFCGYPRSTLEAPGSIRFALHPEDEQIVRESMQQMLHARLNEVTSCEYRLQSKAGDWEWIQQRMTVLSQTMDGKPGKVLSTLSIITKRKQAEELIREYNNKLEKQVEERTAELVHASRAKDEFLATMSHELRTPLNSILGFSETLLEGVQGSINPRQSQAIQTIHSSGKHLLGLINDILDISKLESGKFELQPENVPVNSICESSLGFIKQLANRKSITVEYSPSPYAPTLFADPKRLKQILVNLLNNAVKFTPENGTVKLEVQEDDQAGQMRFSVTDNGIGILPENLQKIFMPFVQLDSSLSRQYEGTGLGLALVQKLVEMHGGSLGVESEAGRGSCFQFSIPIQSPNTSIAENERLPSRKNVRAMPGEPSAQINSGETTAKQKGTKRRILLVEDNGINMMVTSDYLIAKDYEVIEARDGLEAIKQAHEYKPDLILMDIQMFGMDGIETIKHLRAEPEFAHTPIIAVTAFAMSVDRERCLEAGATDYMAKPISLKELAAMIGNLLQSHR